jgi:adenylyl cyclase-associated protein
MAALEGLITKLVDRLESVTARLEKVEKQIAVGGAGAGASASSGAGAGSSSASVAAFEAIVAGHIGSFKAACTTIGGELPELASHVETALNEQKNLLHVASQSKKPAVADFQKLVGPMLAAAQKIGEVKEKARKTTVPNHLATVSEGIGALNWVAPDMTLPAPFIGDMIGGAEFYSNRILKEFKGKDENHVAFVTAFIGILKDLQKFVKQYHTTGLVWNAKGGDALAASSASAAPAAGGPPPPPAGGPPPPPPAGPPPPSADSGAGKQEVDPAAAAGALMAQINSGNVTSGLRKVTKEMKSKNRTDAPVEPVVPKAAPAAAKKTGVVKKGPTKLALEGNKWIVENFDSGNHVIDASDFKQTVYIYKTDNSVIRVNGKINAITLDACKKTSVVFENAIASLEIVNCVSVNVQILGKVPSITIDKTSGGSLILSPEGMDIDIITSKSDALNVVIPGKTAGDDPIELPIPEQFVSRVSGFKLHTESVKHTGV